MHWSSKRMLFVTWAANLGGVQSSLLTRIRGLRELGYTADVLFCHSGNGRDSFQGIMNYVTRDQRTVEGLIRRKQYQAISFINLVPFLPALRKAKFGGKLLYELRGYSEHCLNVCASLSEQEFGGIVVPSHFVRNLIAATQTAHQLPIHVVYNAVDPTSFRPAPAGAGVEVLNPSARQPILLWIGRLDWNKNYPELLQIVALLLREGLNFTTWVVTDSKVSKDLGKFYQDVKVAGLGDMIQVLENVPRKNMPKIYQQAAATGGCVLSTSRSEGLQNTLLEGMACGCPVVTSAVGGNVEIVTHGVNGACYPSGRPELAAREIARLFRDAERRAAFIKAGLEHIAAHHVPRQHAAAYLKVLQGVPGASML